MDRTHTELLAPLRGVELREEARRAALADLAASDPGRIDHVLACLGGLLIRIGSRLEAAERQRAARRSLVLTPAHRGRVARLSDVPYTG
jgi:hypothetical protein